MASNLPFGRKRNYGIGVEDREVVAAVVAGDPAGLAEAYDRYAASLYTYCRTMLRESADAADAVQDTFVIASSKLAQLRDPSKLRTWLYAVARNECHRRLRRKEVTPGLDEVPDVTDETADVGGDAERAELQRLVHDALIGLNANDREVIELNLRHEFEGAELAEALGVSRNHAHAMLSRAKNQLKTSLGALLVARTGRESCSELGALLAGWDGKMSVLLRKQVNRHIESCDICGDRRRRELAPAALFSLLPLAALPPGLRARILRLCADGSPSAVSYRNTVSQRAGSFGADGFPPLVSLPGGGSLLAVRRNALIAAPSAVALIVAVVIVIALAATGSSPAKTSAAGPAGPVVSASSSPGPSAGPGASASAGVSPSASASASAAASASASGAGVVSAPGTSSLGPASSSSRGSSPPGHSPSPPPSHSHSPSPPPSRSPSPSPTTSSPTPSPRAGTVQVNVSDVVLSSGANGGPPTGTFTITAVGGAVSHFWLVISASGLSASPQSGSLAEGQSTTIVLTLARQESLDTQILVNPGNVVVTVQYTPPSRGT
jgi:RNA polymerase sigma factor (sigma-70 family)